MRLAPGRGGTKADEGDEQCDQEHADEAGGPSNEGSDARSELEESDRGLDDTSTRRSEEETASPRSHDDRDASAPEKLRPRRPVILRAIQPPPDEPFIVRSGIPRAGRGTAWSVHRRARARPRRYGGGLAGARGSARPARRGGRRRLGDGDLAAVLSTGAARASVAPHGLSIRRASSIDASSAGRWSTRPPISTAEMRV